MWFLRQGKVPHMWDNHFHRLLHRHCRRSDHTCCNSQDQQVFSCCKNEDTLCYLLPQSAWIYSTKQTTISVLYCLFKLHTASMELNTIQRFQKTFFIISAKYPSWQSIDDTVTRLWAGRYRILILGKARFLLPPDILPDSQAYQISYSMVLGFFPKGKAAGAWSWPLTCI